ncbi:MAG: hypothetical protein ABMA00_00685 [Gemmatimonas sp.]
MRILSLLTGAIALVAIAASAGAQQRIRLTLDATVGAGFGKGGEYRSRSIGGARVAVSTRFQSATGWNPFGELSLDGLSLGLIRGVGCQLNARGACVKPYPELIGATAVLGVATTLASRVDLRFGVGAGAYTADGTHAGAAIAQTDITAYAFDTVGLVAGVRWVVVPQYRGDRLTILPWMIGLRVR